MATCPLSSTFSLPILALPSYSDATASMVGVICRQGPHHSAQKSTSTGTADCSTSWSKPPSVKVSVFCPAICTSFYLLRLLDCAACREDSDQPSTMLSLHLWLH